MTETTTSPLIPGLTGTSLLDRVPVIPVVVLHDPDHAVPVAEALVEGGVPVIELTLRTPAALRCIEEIATRVPQILIGAGTILAPQDARDARSAGAQFLVSPGTTDTLAEAMRATGLPHLPGASTVTEVLRLLELGYSEMKFFPAEVSGGIGFLKAIGSPVPQARFCPTGGITEATAPSYLALPNVGCVGGTWLTPADALTERDWQRITRLASYSTYAPV
jgi:2-dehydro-3-deoxyphosphogluconate aldolase/(4S)-4-hydroxy-2-oxoglutarate aldolase